jgi:tetratricopeptide (TPR) repeat protein
LEKRADVLFRLARFPEAYTCLEEAIHIYRADGSWERLAWSTAQIARVSDSLGWTASSLIRLEELLKTLAAVAAGSDTSRESPAGGENSLERQAASATSLLTPRTAARVYLCLTTRLLFLHRFEEVYEPSERTIQYARASGDLRIESLAYGFRADAQQARGQLAESAASAALAHERAVESDDLEALYIALGAEAAIHELHAEPQRVRETLSSMLETATQLGDVSYIIATLNSLALVAFALGEWDVSAGYFTRSAALLQGAEADRWRWPAGGPAVLNALLSKQGLPLSVTLVGYFTRSATLLQGTGSDSQHLPAIGLAVLGALRAEQDAFLPVAQDGTPVDVEDTVYTRTGVWAIATLAELDILAGRAEAASARLRRAIERFEKMPTSAISLFAPLAWAELECGEQVRAREALAQARQLAGEQRNQMALADIERITAILTLRKRRWAETRRALDQSLAVCQEGPYPYAEAKARYVYGQLDSATGRQAEAREQYERALAICERLGERRYRSHIERALTS